MKFCYVLSTKKKMEKNLRSKWLSVTINAAKNIWLKKHSLPTSCLDDSIWQQVNDVMKQMVGKRHLEHKKNAELTSIAANRQTSNQPSSLADTTWFDNLVAAERQSTEIDQCRWLMIIYILYYRMIRESAKTTREAESNSVQVISHQTTTKIIVELCWASARGEQGWCTHIQLQMHGKAAACAKL